MTTDINLTPTASLIEIARGDGTNSSAPITGRTWGTASECRAAALLIHGLGAHSGWFEALGRRLKVRRMFAVAPDHVGFGKRRKESFQSFHQWLDDTATAYNYVREKVGDKPIYLMGNSMGALVALKIANRIKPNGLVLFSPGFDGHPQTFDILFRVQSVWNALTSPETELALPYSPDQVTRDANVRKWIEADAERRFKLPAKMLFELLMLSQDVQNRVKSAPCPVLMLTAGHEKIVNNKVNDAVFDRLTAPLKQKHVYKDAWHDLMFDPVIDELADRVSTWITETTPEKLIVT
ncbi:MAG: alpha/beta fold hydrolase [Candidatus Melainabacteria bacterium]|jgi:alpha-beta hydrolase superfamily lysophospholipase|nr:alpha/beta fold hydrolase [Candidatus Melainabacteria bacterium]